MTENSEISKLTSANFYCVSLQAAEIILVNLVNKIEIIAKTLFDQGFRGIISLNRLYNCPRISLLISPGTLLKKRL